MRKIYLEYNPYKVETKILVDDVTPKRNSRLQVKDRRLQEWIEDMPEILKEECRDTEYQLTFHGTNPDYEDVEAMATDAEKIGLHISLEHLPAREVADKEASIDRIFQEIQNGPFEELKTPDIKRAFTLAKSSDFEVSVVATMSSGKSTLINALLGQKLMPAKNEACTAKITEIHDNDQPCFSAEAYDKAGQLLGRYENFTLDVMNELNKKESKAFRVRAKGNIPFVPADDVSLVLIDTPGPNNACDPSHRIATRRMLSESSKALVLYVMNATQLGVDDDNILLSEVAESMKTGGKQSRDRFIFVVNKLDEFKKGEDSVPSALKKAQTILKNHGIENPNIYPVSALTALEIRTLLADPDADEDDVDDAMSRVKKFNKQEEKHFETMTPLTPSVRDQIEQKLAAAKEAKDAKGEALIHCGIPSVEAAIRMYVQKYAKTAKIKNIVDTFTANLESAHAMEKVKQEIVEQSDRAEEYKQQIEQIKQKLEDGETAKAFKQKVQAINYDQEIQREANRTVEEAQKRITTELTEGEEKLSPEQAEQLCTEFAQFAENLQEDMQVKLENLIENHVKKNAGKLLEEYRKRLSDLAEDLEVGSVNIAPISLMSGAINSNVSELITQLSQTEQVKVDEEWVENTSKRWYKPWTWLQKKGHWRDVMEDRTFIDKNQLAQQFFAPIEENLFMNRENAIRFAQQQTREVKRQFSLKFDELDRLLRAKMDELNECVDDKKNAEKRLKESQEKQAWLEDIQNQLNAILDI